MTEAEWLACADPRPMLEFLRGKASDRKLRLFAVACCKRIWPFLIDSRSRKAVEVAEDYADGLCSVKDLSKASRLAHEVPQDPAYADAPPYSAVFAIESARIAASWVAAHPSNDLIGVAGTSVGYASTAASRLGWEEECPAWLDELIARRVAEDRTQAQLLRDIVGNPTGPSPMLSPAVAGWNDGTVRRIAQGSYEERAFNLLPILADALLDAGCDDEELLAHCRSEGPHVRGCWAIDCILGKS